MRILKFQLPIFVYAFLCILGVQVLSLSPLQAARPYQPISPDAALEPLNWQSFPELKGSGLRCLVEDVSGKMWFGTDQGVYCYDGIFWTLYCPNKEQILSPKNPWIKIEETNGLSGLPINVLHATKDGKIFAGSEMGISQFNNGIWTRLFPAQGDLPWPIESMTSASDGSLWVATAWGALQFKQKSPPCLLTSKDMWVALRTIFHAPLDSIIVPSQYVPKRLWNKNKKSAGIHVIEGGYIAIHRGNIPKVIWTLASNGPGQRAGLEVGDRLIRKEMNTNDHLDTLSDSTMTLSVLKPNSADTIDVSIMPASLSGAYQSFSVYDIAESNGTIWIGLLQGELLRYDVSLESWHLFKTQTNTLPQAASQPRLLLTRNNMLLKISNQSKGGIDKFDIKTQTWTHLKHDGNQWLYPPKTDQHISKLRGNIHTSILETTDGSIWIGGYSTLYRHYQDKWFTYKQNQPGIQVPSNRIIDLTEASDGALWIVGYANEAIRLDLSRWAAYEGLNFQCELPDGTQWFLSQNGAVKQQGESWTTYNIEDGLMDSPQSLIITQSNELWAVGSHQTIAATAQWNGTRWHTKKHPQLHEAVDRRTPYESSDGSIWFASGRNIYGQEGQTIITGLIQFKDGKWFSHKHVPIPGSVYGMGEFHNKFWIGGFSGLSNLDFSDQTLKPIVDDTPYPPLLSTEACNTLAVSSNSLWVGSRSHGLFRCDENDAWTVYNENQGLSNQINQILLLPNNHIMIAANQDIYRLNIETDTWVQMDHFSSSKKWIGQDGNLRTSQKGDIWLNYVPKDWYKNPKIQGLRTTRYHSRKQAPRIKIKSLSNKKIPDPGAITIEWEGTDYWHDTPNHELLYAIKLNDEKWSDCSEDKIKIFESLPAGNYTFQVKVWDQNLNESTHSQATIHFSVLPPVWMQFWFQSLIVILLSAICFQTTRVIRRGKKLRKTNHALSDANKKLFTLNQQLQEKTQDLTQEISERERLDKQLQNLQYLYRLRSSMTEVESVIDAIQKTGEALLEILSFSGGIVIEYDGQVQTFGHTHLSAATIYRRTLSLEKKERGYLQLFSTFELSESQERTLLDETTGQLTRVLESRELQMQLLQSARLVSLGQMAAGVAHELNQPLGGISATAEDYYLRLQDNMPVSNDQLSETFKRILSMVDRMSNTVEHLRVFSRDTSQEPGTPLDLNDVIHSSLDIIGTQLKNHGVDVKLDLTETLPKITGHPYQLEQIFLNLLGNARDALDTRTESNSIFKTITLSTRQDDDTIIAAVQDNGEGIEPEHLNRIFEPFYTTKPADKGTGLGLSITYAIVKNHGGNITCTSSNDRGTTFEVRFPISTP
ncbi:MAG: C4-dicarboxylate-specific signal transduction histidine kinase [Candidatus Latescibacterota bacterium]|jgi:C4-dicarboxylate-specific signal transduction histidine kinase/ligand-binding sensor domain-containing protein